MTYVIVSIVSLFIGCTIGVITLALCVASKSIGEQEKENDCYNYYDCLDVAFGKCDHCPRNECDYEQMQ